MRKILLIAICSILLTTLLSVVGVRRAGAEARFPFTCESIFRDHHASTSQAVARAEQRMKAAPFAVDEISEARLNRYEHALSLSDADFAEMVRPSAERADDTVATLVAKGHSLEDSVKKAFSSYDDGWALRVSEFDEHGHVRLDRLPSVSLSLENGRQKLDFARIHFSKRDSDLADRVLRDYLSLAEKDRSLRLLIVTNRDDLAERLSPISSDVRERISIQWTDSDLWIWAQDGSKPVDLPRMTAEFGQYRYTRQTQELAKNQVIEMEPVAVNGWAHEFFQGGNIIVGDRNVFVGAAEMNYVRLAYHETEAGALKILSSIFKKPVVPAYIKTSKNAGAAWSFHIDLDMVVALNLYTNREVVLVQSPEALLNALSGLKLPSKLTDEDLLLARSAIISKYKSGAFGRVLAKGSREFLRVLSESPVHELREEIYKSRVFKRLIATYGYETRELPGFGNAQGAGQSMFFGTNAVLTDGRAIIPGNEMPELDRLIRTDYEQLGYDVVQMPSSAATICQQGGLRCVTETYRKPYLTSKP